MAGWLGDTLKVHVTAPAERGKANAAIETILAEAQARGLGWIAWSWSGNSDPILDMTVGFDPKQLTTFGQRIVNGANGLATTSKEASIYSGVPPTPGTTMSATPCLARLTRMS